MLRVVGSGVPFSLLIARVNWAKVKLPEATLDQVQVPRRRGWARERPEQLVADRGYDSDRFHSWLSPQGCDSLHPATGEPQGPEKKVGGIIRRMMANGADVRLGGELPSAGDSLRAAILNV